MKRSILILICTFCMNLAFSQVTVFDDDNVSIGDQTATEKLDVDGNVLIRKNKLSIGEDVGIGDAAVKIGENRSNDGNAYFDLIGDASSFPNYGLRIIRDGSGTSSIVHRGTGPIIFNAVEAGGYYQFKISGTSRVEFLGGAMRPASDGGYNCGQASNRWATVYAVNGTIQTSDARLKKEIAELSYGLDEVLQMRPVSYLWNDRDDPHQRIGLIAQEVDKLVPEVINGGTIDRELGAAEKDQTMGMNYGELVPVLIKAIQEQQAMIEELQRENGEIRALLESSAGTE